MLDILKDTWLDLHPIVCHFPIVLLAISVVLSFAARWKPVLQPVAWLSLPLGTLVSVVANITGIIAHLPYRDSALYPVIQQHLLAGLAVMVIFGSLTLWGWRARQRGVEAGTKWLYLGLAVIGLIVLLWTGLTGGDLVYEYGIGVRGINPLLE